MSLLATVTTVYCVIGLIVGLWVASGTYNHHYPDAFFTVFFVGTFWPLAIGGALLAQS